MLNRRIEVFGRIKPASTNSQIKDYRVEEGHNEDILMFNNGKYSSSLNRTFRFKKIFQPGVSTQEDVFENAARPIIENVLTGYNGTIFAYGQTGTGKTYTMTGDFTIYKERGIIPRTIQFLFHSLKETSTVTISYFEIYNEHGYDLIGFQPTTNTVELQQVNVLEDSKGNLHFRNLSAHNVRSVQEALDLLLFGDGNRMVAETMNNLRSSRSHTVFLVTLETLDPASDSSIRSTLHLVDLAGSERLGKTGNMLNNSWESRYINLSLHYLEQVLVALGEPGRIHIPYRNSLMTTVLKNSLGGNCCTSMIATFSSEPKDFEETLQTCRFSQRVALVRNEARINEVTDINRELLILRRENAYLKDRLREMQAKQSTDPTTRRELLEKDKDECHERVRDFIADSDFMNLPLTDSKKAEYCFMLMRNEILKLKPIKKISDTSDDFKVVNMRTRKERGKHHGYVGYQNYELIHNPLERKTIRNSKRGPTYVLRKRRVWMDIPKIDVIYKKKCKSTESVMTGIGDSDSSNPKRKSYPNQDRISRVSQTTHNPSIILKLQTKAHKGVSSSSSFSEKLEFEIKKTQKDVMECFGKNKPNQSDFHTVKQCDGKRLGVQSLPSSVTEIVELEGEFADNEEDDDDQTEVTRQDSQPDSFQSDRSSRFSATKLPLTGDPEVDEEIIKFYKARYKKFKSKD